jgi:cytochrome b561
MPSNDNSRPPPSRYSAAAKLMHWFVAAAVITLLPLGPIMKRFTPEGPTRDRLYDFHEALGAVVLIVMVLRLARRLGFGVPPPEGSLPAWDRRASLATQYILYPLLFIVPVLGWAGTNAYGDPVNVFGLFTFPAILGKDEALSDKIFVYHLAGGIAIAAVVAAHVSGALYHLILKRDGVFARMWPGR